MENGPTYKKAHFQELVAEMSQLFDVVRLVDPISMTAYTIEDGMLHAQPDSCFHVWNKAARCENCVSARCFMECERYSKFEFIGSDIYHVVAQPVEVDGERYVLEVVTASNDNVLLSAFGNNEFVDRVTTFNRKMYTDDLTGLSNRRYLDERLDILINRSVLDGTPLSVVMLDIDDFKGINDSLGHLAGDSAHRSRRRHEGHLQRRCLLPGEGRELGREGPHPARRPCHVRCEGHGQEQFRGGGVAGFARWLGLLVHERRQLGA